MKQAKATLFAQKAEDLALAEPLFSRLGFFVRDVEFEEKVEKKVERTAEDEAKIKAATEFVLTKYHELHKRLAESERTDPRFEMTLKDLHPTDLKTIEPILKRLGIDFEIAQTR